LPVAVGGKAVLRSLAVFGGVSLATDGAVFALNFSAALGVGLAIDYTLLMISRDRGELADGAGTGGGPVCAMPAAGRTVVFSAGTVALSMAVLVLFPMHFLKSFAYAGVATVTFAAGSAIVVTPAALVLLGDRVNSLDMRRLARRLFRRPEPTPQAVEQMFW